jgi:beta-glucosidase
MNLNGKSFSFSFVLFLISIFNGLTISAQINIYHKGWIDFNKNGKMDVFENPSQPIEKRVTDLLSQMNVDEKTCQMATLFG